MPDDEGTEILILNWEKKIKNCWEWSLLIANSDMQYLWHFSIEIDSARFNGIFFCIKQRLWQRGTSQMKFFSLWNSTTSGTKWMKKKSSSIFLSHVHPCHNTQNSSLINHIPAANDWWMQTTFGNAKYAHTPHKTWTTFVTAPWVLLRFPNLTTKLTHQKCSVGLAYCYVC